MSTLKELLEKASPRPWHVVMRRGDPLIENKSRYIAGYQSLYDYSSRIEDENKVNAALTIRAVNNVDALVDALKCLLSALPVEIPSEMYLDIQAIECPFCGTNLMDDDGKAHPCDEEECPGTKARAALAAVNGDVT